MNPLQQLLAGCPGSELFYEAKNLVLVSLAVGNIDPLQGGADIQLLGTERPIKRGLALSDTSSVTALSMGLFNKLAALMGREMRSLLSAICNMRSVTAKALLLSMVLRSTQEGENDFINAHTHLASLKEYVKSLATTA